MANLAGTWELYEVKNIYAYFREIGIASHDVNEIEDAYGPERKARDIITWSKDGMITVKFTVDGEVIKESTSLPGQVYVDTTWDRRPLQVVLYVMDENTLVEWETGPYEATIIDRVKGDRLIVTMLCNGVKATCTYRRVTYESTDDEAMDM